MRPEIFLVPVFLLLGHASHAATIRHDMGGSVAAYHGKYNGMRAQGERVVVDGHCVSSCAMVLGLRNVCATPRARFFFHGAWNRTPYGPTDNVRGSQVMWSSYPARV